MLDIVFRLAQAQEQCCRLEATSSCGSATDNVGLSDYQLGRTPSILGDSNTKSAPELTGHDPFQCYASSSCDKVTGA